MTREEVESGLETLRAWPVRWVCPLGHEVIESVFPDSISGWSGWRHRFSAEYVSQACRYGSVVLDGKLIDADNFLAFEVYDDA